MDEDVGGKPIISKTWKVEDVGQEQGWPVQNSKVLIQFEMKRNTLDKILEQSQFPSTTSSCLEGANKTRTPCWPLSFQVHN